MLQRNPGRRSFWRSGAIKVNRRPFEDYFPRETLRILESLKFDKETSDKVFYKNLERVTGRTLVR